MTGSASCARGVPAAVDILTVGVISQIMELDNVLFAVGLPERVRARV
eukprot:COSAG03_NODE_22565_length_289_cov_1.089474_1_plen_46_part_01